MKNFIFYVSNLYYFTAQCGKFGSFWSLRKCSWFYIWFPITFSGVLTFHGAYFISHLFNPFLYFLYVENLNFLSLHFELSQTSSSEGSTSKRSQPGSDGKNEPKLSDCGALNLVKHNRRPPPISEESDQTVPTGSATVKVEPAKSSPTSSSSSKAENKVGNKKLSVTLKIRIFIISKIIANSVFLDA